MTLTQFDLVTSKTVAHPSLRERKKERTRLDLMRAAVELFRANGYAATTVDDIVQRADYSRSTFFRYFGAKEDVVFGDLPDQLERFRSLLAKAVEPEDAWSVARSALTQSLMAFVDGVTDVERACIALWLAEPSLHGRYVEMILEWEHALSDFFACSWGLPGDHIVPLTHSAALVGVGRIAVSTTDLTPESVHDVLMVGFDQLEMGLGRPAGQVRSPT